MKHVRGLYRIKNHTNSKTMFPIAYHKQEQFDEKMFIDHLMQLCLTRKNANSKSTFAFILYDESNAHVSKILRDREYVKALDTISGEFFDIFYVNAKFNHHEIGADNSNYGNPQCGEGEKKDVEFGKTPLDGVKDFFKSNLGLKTDFKVPCVIFFQVEDENIIDYFIAVFNDDYIEGGYLQLKHLIQSAVSVNKKYTGHDAETQDKIFKIIKLKIVTGKYWQIISKKVMPKIGYGLFTILIKKITGDLG